VRKILRELRILREDADYRMGRTVDAETVRASRLMVSTLFERLEIEDGDNLVDCARRGEPGSFLRGKKTIGDISLSMDDSRIHLRNGYWRIPIRPSREPSPLFPYYEALADLEDEVQENEGIKVTIASGNPLTD
jgi:hypothetical protein